MFSGIVEATGEILGKKADRIVIRRPKAFDDLRAGHSVSVAGVCLTARAFDGRTMTFDVTEETRRATTFGRLRAGDRVNLERSVRAGDRLEGHIVQGHVEGVGIVRAWRAKGTPKAILDVHIPPSLLPCVVPKGSIAIDGVSLTVAKIEHNICSIAIIPHTRASTTLGALAPGDRVNIETDILVRAIARMQRSAVPSGHAQRRHR